MDYKKALVKLESFRALLQCVIRGEASLPKDQTDQIYIQYGELEELITRFAGIDKISVPLHYGAKDAIYPNYIEAGFLSGRTIHRHQGYTQLLKVIGKVKQLAEDPHIPQVIPSLENLISTLRRFRECCQYIQNPPQSEKEVQDILWIMLRSQYERLEREETLPKFGTKSYRPDFGIPDLGVLIEVKYIGDKTSVPTIQEGILGDLPGYLNQATRYNGTIEFVYDYAHKLRDPRKFIEDLRKIDEILDVLVIPGIK